MIVTLSPSLTAVLSATKASCGSSGSGVDFSSGVGAAVFSGVGVGNGNGSGAGVGFGVAFDLIVTTASLWPRLALAALDNSTVNVLLLGL